MGRPLLSDPDKLCERCGKQFFRGQRPTGQWESRPEFARRKYCSLTCANSKPVVKRQMKIHRARRHLKSQCEACQSTQRLHAHHIDGNHDNWEASNIQTLCTHCHGFWHNMLKRRGLPIGGRMPSLLAR